MSSKELAPLLSHVPAGARRLCARLHDAGFGAWIVGGCVRDLLLGKEVADWDVATAATPDEVKGLFRKVIPTGIQHGTVTVIFEGEPYELTTLRGERGYTDGRRPDEVFYVDDITLDLARRDFTVNAIALDPTGDGKLEDPFGGIDDLRARVIRAVGVPAERFAEDGLRVLRGARFVATLGFTLDPATEAAIPGALAVYRKVSPERIHQEWVKAFRADAPSEAFRVMKRTGILRESCALLDALAGVAVREGRDAWERSLGALDRSAGRSVGERLAALLHAVGQARTSDLGVAPRIGGDLLDAWLRDLRFSNEERKTVLRLVRAHRIEEPERLHGSELRRFVRDLAMNEAELEQLFALARDVAAEEGRDVPALAELAERALAVVRSGTPLRVGDLALDGKDVLAAMQAEGLPPGRAVGMLLEGMLEWVVENPARNDREELLEELARRVMVMAEATGRR